jgi:hypothetical protein
VGFVPALVDLGLTGRGGERVPKMVWRVKLVAELEAGLTTEVEIARLERDERAGLANLGLRLAEAKQFTAALQAEMVPAQATIVGERRRSCMACGCVLASKGHYTATARYAALAPFGKVAALLSELLPISGAQNAGTVRNRTVRSARMLCNHTPPRRQSRPRCRQRNASWLGLMVATPAVAIGKTSATLR